MSRSAALEHDNDIDFISPQHWSREEWFYMWTKGLDPQRIATVCRVPYRKVYEHIRNKIAYQPERFGQRLMLHDHPKLPPGGLPKPKIPWAENAGRLSKFTRVQGRLPRGYLDGEGPLYTFMQYQRQQHRAGNLTEAKKAYLDEQVPGWLTPPKTEREEALWEQRLRELENFTKEHDRYQRYKKPKDPLEKILAVWVDRQRHCLRNGNLREARYKQLNEQVPDWQLGRRMT